MEDKRRSVVVAWRTEVGLSQSELAEKIGVGHSMVSLFESGARPLGPLPALKLQDASCGRILAVDCVSPDRIREVEGLQITRSEAVEL